MKDGDRIVAQWQLMQEIKRLTLTRPYRPCMAYWQYYYEEKRN